MNTSARGGLEGGKTPDWLISLTLDKGERDLKGSVGLVWGGGGGEGDESGDERVDMITKAGRLGGNEKGKNASKAYRGGS